MDVTVSRIIDELKKQRKRQKDLGDFIGVTQNVITDWKSGRIKSYTKYIHGIAEFLGVSVEYLRGETDQKEKPSTIAGEGQEEKRDSNTVLILGRDGTRQERRLTDEQMEALRRMIEVLPDFKD